MNTIKVENTTVERMAVLLFAIFDQIFIECKQEPENLKEAGDLLQIVLKYSDKIDPALYKYFWWFE